MAGFAAIGWVACDRGQAPQDTGPSVVRAHQPLTAARATKEVGESCDTGGASDCLSSLCIHIPQAGNHDLINGGHFCTVQCGPSARDGGGACPVEGFACVQVYVMRAL
jgi:hypothetical protein